MGSYLAAIWRCRFFWLSLVQMDLRTRYRRSVLGIGWSLLQPIAMTVILCTVFHQLFDKSVGEYAPYVLSGLACWNFILSLTLQGCQCFYQGESYIRQYPAPLAVYPLRTALGAIIHFLLALGLVVVVAGCLRGFANPLALLSLVPSVALYFLMGWSVAVITGFATVYFQDIQHLAEVSFQLLFYATPIIYYADQMQNTPLAWLIAYNPVVAFLNLIRDPILHSAFPSVSTYALAGGTVLVTFSAAVFTLVRLQGRLIFRL